MVLDIVLGAFLIAASLFLIVAVLIQSGKSKGLSGSIGGGSSDTYFGRNKGNSVEKKLALMTTIVAIVFVVLVLVVYILQPYTDYYGWLFDRLNIKVN